MGFETFQKNTNDTEEIRERTEGSRRFSLEEDYFDIYVNNAILESFQKELRKFNSTEEQIDEFRYKVLDLNPDEREKFFAMPWEFKQKSFPAFLKRINLGKETMSSYIDFVITVARFQKRKIAYHTSRNNIIAKFQSAGEYKDLSWIIKGTEIDHRDGDMGMAYYSYNYKNLYRVKNPNFLYIVSVQEDSFTGNKKDGNNQWGRSSSLSVIDKIDFKGAIKKINDLVEDELKNDQK